MTGPEVGASPEQGTLEKHHVSDIDPACGVIMSLVVEQQRYISKLTKEYLKKTA